jgi:hypothetical protein
MATLSKAQIQAIAMTVGLPQPELMAAIAMGESSGRTDVVNSIGCVGLWQINQKEWVKSHPTWTVSWLKNPVNNARAAKVIYGIQGLQAWEAYTNGAYKQYLSSTSQGSPSLWDPLGILPEGSTDVLPSAGDALGGLQDIASFSAKAGNWISNPSNWVRILYVIGGAALAIGGVALLARPAVNQVASVLPAGKAATAVRGVAA